MTEPRPSQMKRSNVAVFTKPGQVITMTLADGFRFVGIVYGSSPEAFPINTPGIYEIDIPEVLAKGRYPVAVATVDAAHVSAFERVPVKTVGKMLDALALAASSTSGASND